jgi:hypothetical protein
LAAFRLALVAAAVETAVAAAAGEAVPVPVPAAPFFVPFLVARLATAAGPPFVVVVLATAGAVLLTPAFVLGVRGPAPRVGAFAVFNLPLTAPRTGAAAADLLAAETKFRASPAC